MVTLDFDQKKLSENLGTLRKNRENVPLHLLKTTYKKPYAKLKKEIRAEFENFCKKLIGFEILYTSSDLTENELKKMYDHIQKIINEEQTAGHLKEISAAIFKNIDLEKAGNLVCGYLCIRIRKEVYAPYWLRHIHKASDGTITNDLIPGMVWKPECRMWISEKELKATEALPPTQKEIDAECEDYMEHFKKYLKEVKGNEPRRDKPGRVSGSNSK